MNILKINLFKIIFLLLIFSCGNKFEGNGSITLYGNKIELYEENMVELKVRNSITEKFYKVRWKIIPENAAEIQYTENLTNDYSYKNDRKAVIIPARRGVAVLYVYVTDKFSKMEYLIAEKNINIK